MCRPMKRLPGVMALAAAAALSFASTAFAAGPGPTAGFAPAQFLDQELAGGEPIVFADPVTGNLIYSAHEGTTHLYRPGFLSTTPASWLANYRNQVNIWTSKDNGVTWKRAISNSFNGADPSKDQGFSDPDLTQDEGGRIYDTGIDLANDSIFSTKDGGATWDKGTAQCHNGDRPWLAGGKPDEAWMATDNLEGNNGQQEQSNQVNHTVYHTTDGGNTCSQTGVPDFGPTADGGSYFGFGKIYFDHQRRQLVEPALFYDKDNTLTAIGASTATPDEADTYKFTPHVAAPLPNGMTAHWPGIALDSAGTLYLVWDTNDRIKDTTGGCGSPALGQTGGASPGANSIYMAVSKDFGQTWGKPIEVAHPGTKVFWPWITAGTAGRVGIVYYQSNKLADIDCEKSDISVELASIAGADTESPQITTVDPVGRPIAKDTTVCQGGTTCVATGQDRRLGDYMTVAPDLAGCMMIATGDVTQMDPTTGQPRQTSLPLFVHQNSGTSLTGGACGASTPEQTTKFSQGSGGVTASCRDVLAPRSRFAKSTRATRRGLRLRGSSGDRGCSNKVAHISIKGHVQRVSVAIGREVRGRKCRFLKSNLKFGKARSCLRTSYLRVKGTTHWSRTIKVHLPRGHYKLWVRGIDSHGNVERKARKRNYRRVTVH
jgi:hypothetical protein